MGFYSIWYKDDNVVYHIRDKTIISSESRTKNIKTNEVIKIVDDYDIMSACFLDSDRCYSIDEVESLDDRIARHKKENNYG